MNVLTEEQRAAMARIRKILARTEARGATAEEAATAAEMAQRELQRYNLTLSEVGDGDESTSPGATREKRQTDRRAMYTYQRLLMEALAEDNFCLYQTRTTYADTYTNGQPARNGSIKTKRHLLVGRQVNVDVTVEMYDYLITTMVDEARAHDYDPRTSSGKTFLEGAASRLAERLHARRRKAEEESRRERETYRPSGSGRELVVLEDVYGSEADLNNDEMYGYAPGTTAQRRREDAEKRLRQEVRRKELIEEGYDPTVAMYMSWGYTQDRAVELANPAPESGRGRRYRATGWTQADEKSHRKRNSTEYHQGREAGGRIGIDQQVDGGERRKLT